MPAREVSIDDDRALLRVSYDSERILIETPEGAFRLTREEAWRFAEAIDAVAASAEDTN